MQFLAQCLEYHLTDDKQHSYSHVFDLHDALPYDQAHARYWDDAIHFTPDGYDWIGEKLAAALSGIMAAQRA